MQGRKQFRADDFIFPAYFIESQFLQSYFSFNRPTGSVTGEIMGGWQVSFEGRNAGATWSRTGPPVGRQRLTFSEY